MPQAGRLPARPRLDRAVVLLARRLGRVRLEAIGMWRFCQDYSDLNGVNAITQWSVDSACSMIPTCHKAVDCLVLASINEVIGSTIQACIHEVMDSACRMTRSN